MATDVPSPMRRWWAGCRQHCPAHHVADVRGAVWVRARLGPRRQGLTQSARRGGVVARPRARWARVLAASPGERWGVRQTRVARRRPPRGRRRERWEALWAAVESTLGPPVWGPRPGVQTWPDHRGAPARGASRGGQPGARLGVGSAGGVGDRGGAVGARGLPGPRHPRGVVAGPAGGRRGAGGAVVGARGRARRPSGGPPRWRVVADAACRHAAVRPPLVAAGRRRSRRRRTAAVGGDAPGPVGDKRPRGRPRPRGRVWTLATVLTVAPITALTVRLDGQAAPRQGVWRDVGWREGTHQGRGVGVAPPQAPLLGVRPDRTRPPEAIIPRSAARLPLERTLRDLKHSC